MKQGHKTLGVMLASFILLGCARAPGGAAVIPPLVQAPATPTPIINRWDILLSNGRDWSDDNGWKIVRIEIVVTSKTSEIIPVSIYTKDALLFTDAKHSYPAETLKTTGAKLLGTTTSIEFKTVLPVGYRMKGEYLEDSVVAYSFQSKIPQVAQPESIRIPGYPDIRVQPYSGSFLATESAQIKAPNAQVDFGKVKLTVGSFERKTAWPSTHDLISAKVSLNNQITTDNTTVNLSYVPITEEGIIGAAYTDTSDCKPKLMVGHASAIESHICALVPHGKTKVHLIFWGDGQVVYDTQL